jgi:hypothetical protein
MESLLDHRDASADDERTSEAPETSTPGEHLAEEEDLLLHLEEEEEGLIKAKAVKEVKEVGAERNPPVDDNLAACRSKPVPARESFVRLLLGLIKYRRPLEIRGLVLS